MRNLTLLFLGLMLFMACEKEPLQEEESSPLPYQESEYVGELNVTAAEVYAKALIQKAGWEIENNIFTKNGPQRATSGTWLHSLDRSIIDEENEIAHHVFKIRVGSGKYDMINLHRVTKLESRNFPRHTKHTAFLLHGDFKDFEGMFLPGVKSPRIDDNVGFAVFLAKNNVDVWGIDQAWTLVPGEETDFSFMKDWGMERQVRDLKKAMTLTRVIRFLSGHGLKPLNLLGYSSGSATGFALLDQETSLPGNNRNVAGFISVDFGIVADNPDWDAAMCDFGTTYQGLFDSGQYQDVNPLPLFGSAALADPDGESVLIPGFSNLQAALAVGVYPPFGGNPGYYLAGTFDENSIPTGLQFANVNDWIDFMTYAPPFEPVVFELNLYNTPCTFIDVPWDDHLGQIKNPILYVSAIDGFGPVGESTLNQLGSDDISHLTVRSHSQDNGTDFGHVDLFLAETAEMLMWDPILTWIENH